jgi:hypothetical protein
VERFTSASFDLLLKLSILRPASHSENAGT